MIRKYFLPLIALAGVVFAIYSVVAASKPIPVPAPIINPARAPFESYIAGAGIVEAESENVAIGTPYSGIVAMVHVKVGTPVTAGAPLFSLDDRDAQAELAVRRASLHSAEAKLAKFTHMPRAEDLPLAESMVREAEVNLADLRSKLDFVKSVTDKRAVSAEELSRREYAAKIAETKVSEARAQLALLKAGAWKADLDIARAEVATAVAQVKVSETSIERMTVRAPITGKVLQLNVRKGEFAPSGILQKPLVILGSVDKLRIRVDMDENDAWRFHEQARAVAFVRGNRELKTSMDFAFLEPYVIPKRSLTGESTERVDTRVMQAVYSFDRQRLPVYVGQLMDVFIEAPSVTAPVSLDSSVKAERAGR